MFKKISIAVSFSLLTGCVAGVDLKSADIQQIKVGMNENQLLTIMGRPILDKVIGENNERALVWGNLSTFDMTHETYTVVIKEGKVIKAPSSSVHGRGVN